MLIYEYQFMLIEKDFPVLSIRFQVICIDLH